MKEKLSIKETQDIVNVIAGKHKKGVLTKISHVIKAKQVMDKYNTQVLEDIKKEIGKERLPLFNKPSTKKDSNPNYTAGEAQGKVTAYDKALSIIDKYIK